MKILYVINHMDWFWSHRLPLALGAKKAGYDVDVLCTNASLDSKLQELVITGRELRPGNIIDTIFETRKTVQQTRPDIVHAITLKYAFITGLATLGLKTKRIYTIAGLGYLFSGEGMKPKILRTLVWPFLKLALNNAQLIFQNPDDMALLIRRGLARQDQCHLIRGSGVDTAQFPYMPEPENAELLVVMPTRLVHEKGVAIFIEAARLLKAKGVDARFQIAGGLSTSNPNAISEAQMNAMTADGAAQWLGKVDNMPALLAASAFVVYPSYYREGIPKVLLEAASTGRAIITTDHPGCREAVEHGKNGLLVPVKDATATAAAIEKLLNNPDTRAQMGKASRAKAETEFDVKLIVEQTLNVYGT